MAATHMTDGEATDRTTQVTLEGEATDVGRSVREELSGSALLLYLIGESCDDPDPVRAAKWIVRLKAEGMI